MSPRWEAVVGLVNGAILFVPVFVAIFFGFSMTRERRIARARRIAEYKKSPLSRLLILN